MSFLLFLAAGCFVILLSSPHVLGARLDSTEQVLITLAPLLGLIYEKRLRLVLDKPFRVEMVLALLILLFCFLNAFTSFNPGRTFSQMQYTLPSGIICFYIALFAVDSKAKLRWFDIFLSLCLVTVLLVYGIKLITDYGVFSYDRCGFFSTFTRNCIPEGTLVILLTAGPLSLSASDSQRVRFSNVLLVGLAILFVVLTQKKGSYLAAMAMLLCYAAMGRRKLFYAFAVAILLFGMLVPFRSLVTQRDWNYQDVQHHGIVFRQELWHFGYKVWKDHAILGTGLRSGLYDQYLKNYETVNPKLQGHFERHAAQLQTLDNLILTLFVEMGIFVTGLFLALIFVVLKRFISWTKAAPEFYRERIRLIPLFGFAVHSMTYDSLLFPEINWLFSAQLALLAVIPEMRSIRGEQAWE
jgi:O-antigen ligase